MHHETASVLVRNFDKVVVHSDLATGTHLADVSVFISCALSLAVFDIAKCIEDGVVIEPVHDSTTGTIR